MRFPRTADNELVRRPGLEPAIMAQNAGRPGDAAGVLFARDGQICARIASTSIESNSPGSS
jgi:hypothetical protein